MGCPYTWFKNLLGTSGSKNGEAQNLRVTVKREGEMKVDVALPARSARWLIDLIPEDVVKQILAEGIPLNEIQDDLSQREKLFPQKIFLLDQPERVVQVWLE
jgi:hypothetical protein